jgi:hypothetical protein
VTWGVLIGIVLGWLLAQAGDYWREELRARRARKVAALLIYSELTSNIATVSALRRLGVWTTKRLHRGAWETQGAAFLHRGNLDRAGRLTQAYNSLEDVGFLASEKDRDFTTGGDAEFLDTTLFPLMFGGMREVGPVAGISSNEIENRISASERATKGIVRATDFAPSEGAQSVPKRPQIGRLKRLVGRGKSQ